MTKWTKTDQALFNTLAQMSQTALFRSMKNYLQKKYGKDKVRAPGEYILCHGEIPIMLVAHMDTVFKKPPEKIFYDAQQFTMWSPQGLGADDRAGIYLIWRLIQTGYRPYICLTTDEEKGSLGARAMVKDYRECPFDLKYIVELDRQGTEDCVFYSCANDAFMNFIEDYGFITDFGSFSDISDICPQWKVAGVNLSVGYKNEHQTIETLNTKAMLNTFHKVCHMLNDINSDEIPHFEYVPDPYDRYYSMITRKYMAAYGYDFPDDDDDEWTYAQKLNGYYPIKVPASNFKPMHQCCKCHKIFPADDVFPVKTKNGAGTVYYCLDCVSLGINWCKDCGEAFEAEKETDDFCPDCALKVANKK